MTEYWNRTPEGRWPIYLDIRGSITLVLIEKWGTVAAYNSGEDSTGRAQLDLLPPQELVERCATIADLTVSLLEQRGWIKPDPRTNEELSEKSGELLGIQERHRWEKKLSESRD